MTDAADAPGYPAPRYAWYVVVLLLLAGTTSYLDRYLLALLVGPIRADLHITDTQISLLQGMAFAIFYVVMGLPFGRLVDRSNRRNILIFGILAWSLMTAACGLAQNYAQLFIFRMGVGLGEACLGPAAYSLIADYFPARNRGRAMSVYNMCNYAGSGASLILGGLVLHGLAGLVTVNLPLIGETAVWKAVFLAAGVPGIVIGALMLTIREVPRKGIAKAAQAAQALGKSVSLTFTGYLKANRMTYICLYTCFALIAFEGLTFAAWGPSFLIRQFHLTPTEVAFYTGPLSIVGGVMGAFVSGWWGDKLVARNAPGGRFRLALYAWPLMFVSVLGMCLIDNLTASLSFRFVLTFASGVGLVAGPPTFQDVTPNQFRGQVQAAYFIISGLLGLGIAPTAIALVTDYVFKNDAAIGLSLVVVLIPVSLIGFAACLLGLSAYDRQRLALKQMVDGDA